MAKKFLYGEEARRALETGVNERPLGPSAYLRPPQG